MIAKNNPFNIRYVSSNKWRGQVGICHGFAVFSSLELGVRAACQLVMVSYRRKGVKSVRDIITRFAPPSENDTENYIRFVIKWMSDKGLSVTSDTELVLNSDYYYLLAAMSVMESNYLVNPIEYISTICHIHKIKIYPL